MTYIVLKAPLNSNQPTISQIRTSVEAATLIARRR